MIPQRPSSGAADTRPHGHARPPARKASSARRPRGSADQSGTTRGGAGPWASRTRKHSEAGCGRPVDRGAWTANTVTRPPQQPTQPPIPQLPGATDAHTAHHTTSSTAPSTPNHWAPRTRKRHPQEHRPQRPTERSDPTQHAKGRTGDCPGPRKETTQPDGLSRSVIPPSVADAPPPPPQPPAPPFFRTCSDRCTNAPTDPPCSSR